MRQQQQQQVVRYGQVVVGPPGSGKTTYCNGMQQYLKLLGRNVYVVNLDPANEETNYILSNQNDGDVEETTTKSSATRTTNDSNNSTANNDNKNKNQLLPYEAVYDVCSEIVNLTSVMEKTGLGPNGGLVYCMEYIEEYVDTIVQTIEERINATTDNDNDNTQRPYIIFDLPGQIELYTHSECVQKLIQQLAVRLNLRLTAVQLIDAHYCTDSTKFIASSVLGTTTMIRLELPIVNVLSKVDLLSRYGELSFQFDFYTDCHDLDRLLPYIDSTNNTNNNSMDDDDEFHYADDPEYQRIHKKRQESSFYKKHVKLHKALAEIVDDFGLLSFLPLDISDAESVGRVLAKIDKCNGYVFLESESVNANLFNCAIQSSDVNYYETVADVRERIASPESIQELRTTTKGVTRVERPL